jgi:hypothetical protein
MPPRISHPLMGFIAETIPIICRLFGLCKMDLSFKDH